MKQSSDIRNLLPEQVGEAVVALGCPAYRARQILNHLYQRDTRSFADMTDLPIALREALARGFSMDQPVCEREVRGEDGTRKALLRFTGGGRVETVLIASDDRRTVCVSTQIGCARRCLICTSGVHGLTRSLEPSEIVAQVLYWKGRGSAPDNVVFMGMGEPFDNFDHVMKAVAILNHPEACGIAARKIAVSTCGVIPGILKFAELGGQVRLSLSLHATDDGLRDELMPVNKKYPLKELLAACRVYRERTGRQMTIEYALIRDVNDQPDDAERLILLARDLGASVNLIGCSPVPGSALHPTHPEGCLRFAQRLRGKHIRTTLRVSRGADILAACGQLAGGRR